MDVTITLSDVEVAAIEDNSKQGPRMPFQGDVQPTAVQLVTQQSRSWIDDQVRQFKDRQMRSLVAAVPTLSPTDQAWVVSWLAARQPAAAETMGKIVGIDIAAAAVVTGEPVPAPVAPEAPAAPAVDAPAAPATPVVETPAGS